MRNNPRILIVEDDPTISSLTKLVLEKCDHWEPIVVTNGEDAMRVWKTGNLDFILMDLRLPKIDGMEVTRRIRAAECKTGIRIPILAFTASVSDERRRECEEAGFDEFLPKPVRLIDLIEAVERYMPNEHKCKCR